MLTNEMATLETTPQLRSLTEIEWLTGRLFRKAVQQGRSERRARGVRFRGTLRMLSDAENAAGGLYQQILLI